MRDSGFSSTICRRKFIAYGGWLAAGAATAPDKATAQNAPEKEDIPVSPLEDLMREHGLLDRILLLFEEVHARLKGGQGFPIETIGTAAGIVRHFVEDYHEKLEEDHIFPRFEKAGKLNALTEILRGQHKAGRTLTDWILAHATESSLGTQQNREEMAGHLGRFVRMYRPHKAREDTELFPAFRAVIAPREYDALGERFEDEEHKLFGAEGFEKNVETVAQLERGLDIFNLGKFTKRPMRPAWFSS